MAAGWPCPASPLATDKPRRLRRIAFVDFWPGFDTDTDRWLNKSWFAKTLVDVEIVNAGEPAEVTVFSVFGHSHRQLLAKASPSTKLVFFTGENLRPPVGKVPLCLSFDHVPRAPSSVHTRLPLWVLNAEVAEVVRLHEARLQGAAIDPTVYNRSFCSWVASNAGMYNAGVRTRFVQTLMDSYKKVACGGPVMNNVGGPVEDKMFFLRGYKFNIAFENASRPGYCTEKLLHAFAAGCVPIYWGDPNCSRTSGAEADFNPAAMISAHDFETPSKLIDHIRKVDGDPTLFAEYLKQPILSSAWYARLRVWDAFRQGLTELLFEGAFAQLERQQI